MKPTLILITIYFNSTAAIAIESAKVLPKGVRNFTLRTVDSDLSRKTNENGDHVPLAQPLSASIKFKNVIKNETSLLKQSQIRALMNSNGFREDESVGSFNADLNGHVRVFAPVFAYGVSEKLTLALVAPIYSAQTSVKMGFRPTARGQEFINALAKPENNLTSQAHEAADRINRAIEKFHEKLASNGYHELQDWQSTGMGDMQIAAKYAVAGNDIAQLAVTGGVVAPTGRVKDPNILNDIPFGDGQWDLYSQFTVDEQLSPLFIFNQYIKYTSQLPGKKRVRQQTEDEPLEVPVVESDFKLGDKVETGLGLTYAPYSGILVGLGYNYMQKFSDRYRLSGTNDRMDYVERQSDQSAQYAEFMLGYSGVPAYKRGSIPAPFEMKGSYLRQLRSQNLPVTDVYQVDASLFF